MYTDVCADLYGLVLFLGLDPYWVKHWWDQLLYRPYRRGNTEPLYSVIAQILWRSAKKDVIDQVRTQPALRLSAVNLSGLTAPVPSLYKVNLNTFFKHKKYSEIPKKKNFASLIYRKQISRTLRCCKRRK